jgi:hypothetical protein
MKILISNYQKYPLNSVNTRKGCGMKKVWITSLVRDKELVSRILSTVKKYGLDGDGHFWVDDLQHMAWLSSKERIIDSGTDLWVIMGSKKDMEKDSVRYGLALLTLAVQAKKGHGFHIIWISPEGDMDPEFLPTPLKGAEMLTASSTSLGAKLVARANTPAPAIDAGYRVDIHANPGFGLWIEVGPGKGHEWKGAMLGVNGGEIDAHGIGNSGRLPQRSVLEYPMRGLKLKLGDAEYTAWAVQNLLTEELSYYTRIRDIPKGMLFGPYSQEEEAEVHVIKF